MLYSFIVALFVVAQVYAGSVPTFTFEDLKNFRRVATNSTSAPTQYLITSLYKDPASCSGASYQSMGVGYGSCMGGSGYSMMYTDPTDDGTQIKMSMNYYTTNDCSGTPMTYPMSYSKKCTAAGTYGMTYSLASSATPWDSLGAGVVNQAFTDESICTAGGTGNTFSFTALNSCFEVTSTDNASKSQMFTACDSQIHYKQYSDAACQVVLQEASGVLTHCYHSTVANDFESVSCGV